MPAGCTETARGPASTGTVATTMLVAVSITETVSEEAFVTYARVPAGCTETPWGLLPTGTVATTMLVAVSITETLSEELFTT